MATKSVAIKITGNNDSAVAAVKGVKMSFTELNQAMEVAKKAYGAVSGALQQAYGMAEAAAGNARISASFDDVARRYNIDSKAMIQSLMDVTKNTIDDDEIMAKVNQTLSTGIVKNQDQIVKIMEIARRKGKEMGIDTLTAYDMITNGVEGMNEKMFRNMGITVDTTQLYQTLADELGITTGELTDQQKQQELLWYVTGQVNDQIKAQGEDTVDAKDKFDQLKTKMGEYKDDIGNALLPMFDKMFIALDTQIIPGIKGVFDWFSKNQEMTIALGGAIGGLILMALAPLATTLAGIVVSLAAMAIPLTIVIGGGAAIALIAQQLAWAVESKRELENSIEALNAQAATLQERMDAARAAGDEERFRRLAVIQAQSQQTSAEITQAAGPGGLGGFLQMIFGNTGDWWRASGGPVSSGSPYIVGEQGPELFVPSSSGNIIPNGAGGSVVINITEPHVRDDADLRRIADYVMGALARTREVSLRGAAI